MVTGKNRPAGESIVLAADHAGLELKNGLKDELARMGYGVIDLGTHNHDPVDYPDFGLAAAKAVSQGPAKRGVIVCGSGIGISIAANRVPGVRAALCHDANAARMARQHNDANILALAGRAIDLDTAKACLHAFLETPFEGGRHAKRVAKLDAPR
jgi:ribose 5-phosphate isomerase B